MRNPREILALGVRRLGADVANVIGLTSHRIARRHGVAVLMYHRVLDDGESAEGLEAGMFVRASTFRRQLQWLTARWPVRTLGDWLGQSDTRSGVALTFDDGWRDNLSVAWPIMEELGVRATIFLVRDWIRASRSGSGKFLCPGDVAGLSAAGVEFGAHTVSHPHLDQLTAAAALEEMRLSREAIEEWTSQPCRVFAYPFGHHSDETVELARATFAASVTVGGGWWSKESDLARIPRIAIHEDMSRTISQFALRLASLGGGT